MINDNPSAKFKIISEMLQKEGCVLTVTELCELANVSRSGYYNWIKKSDVRQQREENDRNDFELILKAYQHRGYDKGARGIHMQMLHWKPMVVMNIKKIRRLMKKYGLYSNIRKANPYRRMMKAMRTNCLADNILQRRFKDFGPRKVLLTDITYIPFNQDFLYLSVILDAYTKQVLSYKLSNSLKIDFVLDTVRILIDKHGISLSSKTMIHSDQGCHYTSYKFIEIIESAELRRSMSRRGNCWDNAPQESFFGHMKDEIILDKCTTFQEVEACIDDWMDYYNSERYQWQLCKLSPDEYYEYIQTGIHPLDEKR